MEAVDLLDMLLISNLWLLVSSFGKPIIKIDDIVTEILYVLDDRITMQKDQVKDLLVRFLVNYGPGRVKAHTPKITSIGVMALAFFCCMRSTLGEKAGVLYELLR